MNFSGKTAFITGAGKGIGRIVNVASVAGEYGISYLVDGCRKKL